MQCVSPKNFLAEHKSISWTMRIVDGPDREMTIYLDDYTRSLMFLLVKGDLQLSSLHIGDKRYESVGEMA